MAKIRKMWSVDIKPRYCYQKNYCVIADNAQEAMNKSIIAAKHNTNYKNISSANITKLELLATEDR